MSSIYKMEMDVLYCRMKLDHLLENIQLDIIAYVPPLYVTCILQIQKEMVPFNNTMTWR